MQKLIGYIAWMFFPENGTYSSVRPANELVPELDNLVEHFDVRTIKITLTDGTTINVKKGD